MTVRTIPGVTARTVTTARLTTRVLFSGPDTGEPVLFLHGNLSSATWWETNMVDLPEGYHAIAPDQRGYGDADPDALIDATRGLGDFVDDAIALMDHLGHDRFHVVGSSLGGLVVWWLVARHAARLLTVTQVAPGSPYGFGGSKGVEGTPTTSDFAGSGAGLVNPQFVAAVAAEDRSDAPGSPRQALRTLVWAPDRTPDREDAFVDSLLQIHLGDAAYPGDVIASEHWPFVAPGVHGPNNALSPKYAIDVGELIGAEPKPPVLWLRGDRDLAVSDRAASDPGVWGPSGVLPGYPGPEAYPPQPMIEQTRAVLDAYAAAGGEYREVVMEGCAHVPYIECPDEFGRLLAHHVGGDRQRADQSRDGPP